MIKFNKFTTKFENLLKNFEFECRYSTQRSSNNIYRFEFKCNIIKNFKPNFKDKFH